MRQISQDAKYACDFQALLFVHPSVEDSTVKDPVFEVDPEDQEPIFGSENTYAMMLSCQTPESKLVM